MIKSRNIFGCLCGLLAASLLSGAAYLSPREGPPLGERSEKRFGGPFSEMAKELKLAPEQLRQIEDNRKQHMQEERLLREEMMRNRDQMRQELSKPQFDMEKIKLAQERIKELMGKEEDFRLAGFLELRKILTPEQFSLFNRKMEERMRKFGPPKGPPHGNPPFDGPPPPPPG